MKRTIRKALCALAVIGGALGYAVPANAQTPNPNLYGWLHSYWYYDQARHSDAWLLALGQCEQGDRWDVFGPTYEGHFGMMAGLWDTVRRPEWPDNMGAADWAQQMAGVRLANTLVGDGAWGCSGQAWAAAPGG